MAFRLASLLPRFVALPLVAVLATATLTFAANTQLTPAPPAAQPAATRAPAVLVVPDVTRQAFVFAKGTLEDAGFAWQIAGSVHGYAANSVTHQSPAPGTRVVDTGAPTVKLMLAANKNYPQEGTPEDSSPYAGTEIRFAANAPSMTPSEPVSTPEPTDTVATTPAKPKTKKKSPTKAQPTTKRPAAFVVAGAPKEPLDEMPLVDRAQLLGRYVEGHSTPTPAAVNHFLYQHSWIVTGAEFGWWRGADALKVLIAVDRRAQQHWGFGAKSEAAARAALARVQAKSK